jgi:AcrR family transcriptional regulator
MADAMAEQGYVATSVSDVIERAGTSRETFYQQFSSKEDCFVAAYEAGASRILQGIRRAAAAEGGPLQRFDHAISAYLDGLAAEPAFARLFLVEVFAAGPAALKKRARLQHRFGDLMAENLRANSPTERFACEVLVAGVSAMVTARLAAGDIDGPRSLGRPLTDLVAEALSHRESGRP